MVMYILRKRAKRIFQTKNVIAPTMTDMEGTWRRLNLILHLRPLPKEDNEFRNQICDFAGVACEK